MNTQSVLEKIAHLAYEDEMDKIALSPALLMRTGRKAINKRHLIDSFSNALHNYKPSQKASVNYNRNILSDAFTTSKSQMSKEPLRNTVKDLIKKKQRATTILSYDLGHKGPV